jgi:hypothetical protein
MVFSRRRGSGCSRASAQVRALSSYRSHVPSAARPQGRPSSAPPPRVSDTSVCRSVSRLVRSSWRFDAGPPSYHFRSGILEVITRHRVVTGAAAHHVGAIAPSKMSFERVLWLERERHNPARSTVLTSGLSPIRHSGRRTVRAQLRRQRPHRADRAGDERIARIGIVRTVGVRRVLRRESDRPAVIHARGWRRSAHKAAAAASAGPARGRIRLSRLSADDCC